MLRLLGRFVSAAASIRCPVSTLGQILAANLEVYARRPDPALREFIKQRLAQFEYALIHDLGGAAN